MSRITPTHSPEQLDQLAAQLGPLARELRGHIDGLIATMQRVEAAGLPVPPVIVPTVNQLGVVFAIVAGAEARGTTFVKGAPA